MQFSDEDEHFLASLYAYYGWPRVQLRRLYWFLQHTFYYGPKNLIRWVPMVWKTGSWDWTFLTEMMELKIREMADSIEKNGHHLGAKRNVRQMRICVHILRRLDTDIYVKNASKRFGRGRYTLEYSEELQKQDLHLLFTIMEKHLRSWWD